MENDEKVKVPLVTVEEPVEDTVEPKEVEVEDPIDEDNKDANMESEKKKKKNYLIRCKIIHLMKN